MTLSRHEAEEIKRNIWKAIKGLGKPNADTLALTAVVETGAQLLAVDQHLALAENGTPPPGRLTLGDLRKMHAALRDAYHFGGASDAGQRDSIAAACVTRHWVRVNESLQRLHAPDAGLERMESRLRGAFRLAAEVSGSGESVQAIADRAAQLLLVDDLIKAARAGKEPPKFLTLHALEQTQSVLEADFFAAKCPKATHDWIAREIKMDPYWTIVRGRAMRLGAPKC